MEIIGMNTVQIIELIVVLIFALAGLFGAIGSIVVWITPSDADDKWWNQKVVPKLVAFVPGYRANQVMGNGKVDVGKLKNDLDEAVKKVESILTEGVR